MPTSHWLRLLSLVSKSRLPKLWQIELTLKLLCFPRKIRTRPPFNCHRAKDQQEHLHHRMAAEAAMGQHAMVAQRQAEPRKCVHGPQEGQIRPVQSLVPQQAYSQNHSEEGDDDHRQDKCFEIRY